MHKELVGRVEQLHRIADASPTPPGSAYLDLEPNRVQQADPVTAAAVRAALLHRRVSPDRWTVSRAERLAAWADDPSTTVRAAFGVDRVMVDAIPAAGALATSPERTWTGCRFPSAGSLVQRLDVVLGQLRDTGVVEVTWTPPPGTHLECDSVRPPAEALLAVAAAVEPDAPRHILAVNLGHDAVHRLLVAIHPGATLWSAGVAYRMAADFGPALRPDVVLWNIPSAPALPWSRVIGAVELHPGLRHRILRNLRRRAAVHPGDPQQGIAVVGPRLEPGVILAVVANVESGAHGAAVRALRSAGHRLVPHGHHFDGDRRAGLFRYSETPWTPMGVPAPTGRLVSLWRVA